MTDDERQYAVEVNGHRVGPVTGLDTTLRVKRRFRGAGYSPRIVPLIPVEAAFQRLEEDRLREESET